MEIDKQKLILTETNNVPRLRRHSPDLSGEVEREEFDVPSKEDFLAVGWIAEKMSLKNFYRFSQNEMGGMYRHQTALLLELDEGKTCFVIGWIKSKEKIDWLPHSETKKLYES